MGWGGGGRRLRGARGEPPLLVVLSGSSPHTAGTSHSGESRAGLNPLYFASCLRDLGSSSAEIKDTYGRTLFRLETKLLSLLKSFFATDPATGKEIFQVKSKFSSTS